jgi:hypothetical protein
MDSHKTLLTRSRRRRGRWARASLSGASPTADRCAGWHKVATFGNFSRGSSSPISKSRNDLGPRTETGRYTRRRRGGGRSARAFLSRASPTADRCALWRKMATFQRDPITDLRGHKRLMADSQTGWYTRHRRPRGRSARAFPSRASPTADRCAGRHKVATFGNISRGAKVPITKSGHVSFKACSCRSKRFIWRIHSAKADMGFYRWAMEDGERVFAQGIGQVAAEEIRHVE